MKHVVARCENCGAALRVDPSAVRVDCDYCRVTCFVKDAPPNTPQVTIAPAPEPVDETKLTLGIGIVCAVLALGGVVIAATSGGDARAIGAGVLFIGIFGTLAVLAALGYPRKKEYLRHVRRLRDEGIPGRATVKSVGAAGDRNAKLQLDVETGSSTRRVVHETTIPALLVPQIVSGAALPVLVHPTNPDEIEIQWHLL